MRNRIQLSSSWETFRHLSERQISTFLIYW